MTSSRSVTAQNAVNAVSRYVTSDWMSQWQEYSAANDDGIDGHILLRRKRLDRANTKDLKNPVFKTLPVRGVVYVQVKGGESYCGESKKRPGYFEIHLTQEYIDKHRDRWNAMPGPVILVYVDTVNLKQNLDAWWTDLKDDTSYTTENRHIALVPKRQRFGPHSKGELRKLIDKRELDKHYTPIRAARKDIEYVQLDMPIKVAAQRFYREWAKSPIQERSNRTLGEVRVSRVGWRHITRSGRRPERILQSLLLLGVAKRIISEVEKYTWVGRMADTLGSHGCIRRDLIGIRAQVTFPHRHSATVQVILERKQYFDANGRVSVKLWFYSVYEVRRGLT